MVGEALGAVAGEWAGTTAGQRFERAWEDNDPAFARAVSPMITRVVKDIVHKLTVAGVKLLSDGEAKRMLTDAFRQSAEFNEYAQQVLGERGLPLYWL